MPPWSSVLRCGFLKSYFSRSAKVAATLAYFGCCAHLTITYVGRPVVCSGLSMLPTIEPNDVLLTEMRSVPKQLQAGDVVIVVSPRNPKQYICKRLVGVEGDRIEDPAPFMISSVVPRGHVWLEGDNSEDSIDSREYGPVPLGLIDSRVSCKVWPLKSIGRLAAHNKS